MTINTFLSSLLPAPLLPIFILTKENLFSIGLVLLFILPRHTFACVQSALFPKYMVLNGIAALAVLISFVQTKKIWSSQENYQVKTAFLHLNQLLQILLLKRHTAFER